MDPPPVGEPAAGAGGGSAVPGSETVFRTPSGRRVRFQRPAFPGPAPAPAPAGAPPLETSPAAASDASSGAGSAASVAGALMTRRAAVSPPPVPPAPPSTPEWSGLAGATDNPLLARAQSFRRDPFGPEEFLVSAPAGSRRPDRPPAPAAASSTAIVASAPSPSLTVCGLGSLTLPPPRVLGPVRSSQVQLPSPIKRLAQRGLRASRFKAWGAAALGVAVFLLAVEILVVVALLTEPMARLLHNANRLVEGSADDGALGFNVEFGDALDVSAIITDVVTNPIVAPLLRHFLPKPAQSPELTAGTDAVLVRRAPAPPEVTASSAAAAAEPLGPPAEAPPPPDAAEGLADEATAAFLTWCGTAGCLDAAFGPSCAELAAGLAKGEKAPGVPAIPPPEEFCAAADTLNSGACLCDPALAAVPHASELVAVASLLGAVCTLSEPVVAPGLGNC